MEVRIGVTQSPKELELETNDKPEEVTKAIEAAIADGDKMLWLTDRKGRKVGVPAAKIAYVEIGSPSEDRRVGFGVP
ncbi:MAG TPA: DUF3107 domain-containing protein [Acidimicrobiales bacterium]|nr:DUF3107 domain-containing protein [Acidimicrobiales bacterium]